VCGDISSFQFFFTFRDWCLSGLDVFGGHFFMMIRRSRSLQCLMLKIFETTYHHKLPFNSKDY
jgi:hypothetical protein